MTRFDPGNQLHVAALDHAEKGEALAQAARVNVALANAADREGVDNAPLVDAAATICELAERELMRSAAILDELET